MDCDQVRELLEAYALGALDADEQARVEQHLAGCAECRQLVAEYAETVHRLPQALAAVSPLNPPSSLKDRVMQALPGEQPALPPALTPVAPVHPAQPGVSLQNGKGRQPLAVWQWALHQPRLWAVLAGVAVLLLLVLLAWNAQLNIALSQERTLREELANLVGQQETVLDVVDSPGTVRLVLRPPQGTSVAPNAPYGKLFARPDMPYVVAMAARLPRPPPGQAYVLWLTSGGETTLAGVLDVNGQGFGQLVLHIDHNGPSYDSAQINLQPRNSTTPAGQVVLVWNRQPNR